MPTRIAGCGDPLDAHSIADLDAAVLGAGAQLDDLADSLVAADLAGLDVVW